ncbi:hypothetical protein BJ322DRAFT_1051358 [Thelephora terrestris]|uniref:Uncharacterized protein n=1 Tax=Thelephora terrestris TaxID=56493 RepID=A0A9P6HGR2_9AGAM|nr:hypothetical protein BJ322DRAFT_1051358 [Thelephora terrestris]
MTWQFWLITGQCMYRKLTPLPSSRSNENSCEKTAFFGIALFVVCTLLAQTVLTARIYVVTMGNVMIVTGFTVITVAQCVLGLCMTILTAKKGAQTEPPIPFDAYHLCVFTQIHRSTEVAYTSLSLLYDILAFLVIVFRVRTSRVQGLKVSTILDTIAEDSTRYFMVIFTSHFVLVMTLNLGRASVAFSHGVLVYLPLMTSRIMLSLKKAADSSQSSWSLVQATTGGKSFGTGIIFSPPSRRGATTREEDNAIPLDTFCEA